MKKENVVALSLLSFSFVLCLLSCQTQADLPIITLPEDGGVYGSWDGNIYTLTGDIDGYQVYIDAAPGVTINGGGYSITGTQGTGGDGNGVPSIVAVLSDFGRGRAATVYFYRQGMRRRDEVGRYFFAAVHLYRERVYGTVYTTAPADELVSRGRLGFELNVVATADGGGKRV